MNDAVRIRPATAEDVAFIVGGWHPQACAIAKSTNDRGYVRRVKRSVADQDTRILVACCVEDDATRFGFVAFGDGALHWLYVADVFRGFGIGRTLCEAAVPTFGRAPTIVTVRCPQWEARAGRFGLVLDETRSRDRRMLRRAVEKAA